MLILDNASIHKGRVIDDLAARYQIRIVYLPAYSPDLNPIEKSFSKVKAVLQRDRGRCKPLVDDIKTATMSVTKEDVAGWFRGCSYVLNENGLMELGLPEEEAS